MLMYLKTTTKTFSVKPLFYEVQICTQSTAVRRQRCTDSSGGNVEDFCLNTSTSLGVNRTIYTYIFPKRVIIGIPNLSVVSCVNLKTYNHGRGQEVSEGEVGSYFFPLWSTNQSANLAIFGSRMLLQLGAYRTLFLLEHFHKYINHNNGSQTGCSFNVQLDLFCLTPCKQTIKQEQK